MRFVALCGAIGALFSATAGAVIILPAANAKSEADLATTVLEFSQLKLAPQEEWQLAIPPNVDLPVVLDLVLAGRMPNSSTGAAVWVSYLDGQVPAVAGDPQTIVPHDFSCRPVLPAGPAALTLHVQNLGDKQLVMTGVTVTAAYGATPDPATVGLLAVGCLGPLVRRRVLR